MAAWEIVVLSIAGVALAVLSYLLVMQLKRAYARETAQRSKLKKQMTSNIAHELRTPVTSIRGYLETLIACPDMSDEKKQAFIEKAYNQTLRLSELISDMSLLSKMEERSAKLNKEEVDLYDIANEVFDEFEDRIKEKGNVVENLLEPGTVLIANKTLVYTIIRNLVENSLKYAGDGIIHHIECYSTIEHFCYLTYYDTGSGVPHDHLERIFERFYRIEEGRTRDVGGSGLGLSIVRNAVKFHGGDIRVINRQWGGLQFFFSLRRKDD
ncbi:MAG: HAMP domain-containing histidine kinase [Bacteroidales bacterium]|nr:HAMP domain-containing histidine kinase [Bacteroidales bacterium]